MFEIKRVKAGKMVPVIREILERGVVVKITVTGTSMYPFLREEKDSVELSHAHSNQIRRGDIVLVVRDSGEYILHRVFFTKREAFYLVGDNQQCLEGPLHQDQLIAVVTAVWRSNSRIPCTNLGWRLLSELWLLLLLLRAPILKVWHFCYRIRLTFIRN